jgi:glycosyltransferase involved in cell wall biosynthesis
LPTPASSSVYLVLTPFFPTESDFPGSFVYDHLRALQKTVSESIVVIKLVDGLRSSVRSPYVFRGFPVFPLPFTDLPSLILPGLFHRANWRRLKQLVEKHVTPLGRVTIVHAHVTYPCGDLALALARHARVPVVLHHHGLDVIGKRQGRLLRGPLRNAHSVYLERRLVPLLNAVDLNVGVSSKVLGCLDDLPGFRNPNRYVLLNGLHTGDFFRQERPNEPRCFTIGCVANFIPIKGQMVLLRALALLRREGNVPAFRAIFIGRGPTLETCKRFSEDAGLSGIVDFQPTRPHADLNSFYNSIDLFVMPSHYEALGCVYLEALQVGCPIIGVRGMGVEDVLTEEDKAVSLIDPEDFHQLATLIRYRMSNPTLRSSYDFDILPMTERFVEVLRAKGILASLNLGAPCRHLPTE